MAKAKVPIFGQPLRCLIIDTSATNGATFGFNLYDEDGHTLLTWDTVAKKIGAVPSSNKPSSDIGTTDDLQEGQWNLYFTAQRAQDAVGTTLTNTSNVTLTYDGAGHTIKADLTSTGVVAGTYGDSTHAAWVQVDAKGRVVNAGQNPMSASTSRFPVVTGDVPPVLVYLDDGSLVYVEI